MFYHLDLSLEAMIALQRLPVRRRSWSLLLGEAPGKESNLIPVPNSRMEEEKDKDPQAPLSKKDHNPLGDQLSGRRLVIASNREPYIHKKVRGELRWERPAGGLTSALDPLLRQVDGVWVAWGSGDADKSTVNQDNQVRVPPDDPSYTLRRVWLSQDEILNYYYGYSNRFLWPLCHMTLDRVIYRQKYWDAYRAVNERFAQTILEELGDQSGRAWIHDYHLALCPKFLRSMGKDLQIGFFWHIPWPAHDVFRICPQRKELLEGLLSCDQVGFHLDRYRKSFLECVQQELDVEIDSRTDTVIYRNHRTKILALPVGIDYQRFDAMSNRPETVKRMKNLRSRLKIQPDFIVGLGVDRLDYTKGLLKRLWALDEFLHRYPKYHSRFLFIQIATPSRAESDSYRQYRGILQSTVNEINSKYGKSDWKPIEYIEGQMNHESLVAYYRMATFCLVSSVYDGLNLVSKEYVASQVEEDGVLVLSEMAGSLEELDGALPINPYDVEGIALTLSEAVEMKKEERIARMSRMRTHIQKYDIFYWMEANLEAFTQTGE